MMARQYLRQSQWKQQDQLAQAKVDHGCKDIVGPLKNNEIKKLHKIRGIKYRSRNEDLILSRPYMPSYTTPSSITPLPYCSPIH